MKFSPIQKKDKLTMRMVTMLLIKEEVLALLTALVDSEVFQTYLKTFGDMGGRQTRQREQRGQDLKYEVDVDLREAYTGLKKEISFDTLVRCDNCSGSGSESGSGLKTCNVCGGSGRTRASQGFFTVERTCSQLWEVLDKL